MRRARLRVLRTGLLAGLLIVMTSGCGDGRDADLPDLSLEASAPGVYSGVFPCDGCAGIETRLWIRPDGRFFIEQVYPATEGRAQMVTHNLGHWAWSGPDAVVVLVGAGPERRFHAEGRDSLILLTHSNLEHRLERDPESPAFTSTLELTGTVRGTSGGADFTECLTGLTVRVADAGDYRRFLHQYRSAGQPGRSAYVEFEGRFAWLPDGAPKSLTIERFTTIKPGAGC